MDEVRDLLAEFEAQGRQDSIMPVRKQLALLRALRKTRLRRPDVAVAAGRVVIEQRAASDEESTWVVIQCSAL